MGTHKVTIKSGKVTMGTHKVSGKVAMGTPKFTMVDDGKLKWTVTNVTWALVGQGKPHSRSQEAT